FNYIGTRYVWGGNSLTGGIDCSGFVKELYEGIGVNLPRTAREQARVGKPIERLEDLRAGDRLYFWDRRRGYIGHTGIFLGYHPDGGAYFIHSSSNNRGVATDDLRNPKWRNILVGARR
ncbi:MAG: C40 family peptidase, partial [Fimbriimonadaceae bacterium]|nr:C40 family peptidase [Fimbriimonadaceae bacterium]